mgnify:FL=1
MFNLPLIDNPFPLKLWVFYDLKNRQIFCIPARFKPFRFRLRFIYLSQMTITDTFLKSEAENTRTVYQYWQGTIK